MNNPEAAQKAIVAALAVHSAYLYRSGTLASNQLQKSFNAPTKRMISDLAEQLDGLSDSERVILSSGRYDTPRLKRIKKQVDEWAATINSGMTEVFTADALALAGHEIAYINEAMNKAIDTQRTVDLSPEKSLRAAKRVPVTGGELIDRMFSKITTGAQDTVWNTIRQGVVDGQTNSQIIRALRGKPEFEYADSVLAPTRREIESTVRTARNHISNNAYNDTYAALGVKRVVFVSVLDSRTSKVCASLDGTRYAIDESHPMPPMHRNCRSVIAPVFDDDLIGNRPAKGSDGTTQVNANTTYASWFKNQSAEFQKDWLGASKYALYSKGGYALDRFVDPIQGELTLNELRLRDQRTFKEVFG